MHLISVGLFIVGSYIDRFPELRDALEKLQLNDAALKVNFTAVCYLISHSLY